MRLKHAARGIAVGMILSAALTGCGGSQEAGAPAGGTSPPTPAPGVSTPAPAPTGPAAGTAPADAGTPKITERPSEPTPTPEVPTDEGGAEKGAVKQEEPPKGA